MAKMEKLVAVEVEVVVIIIYIYFKILFGNVSRWYLEVL